MAEERTKIMENKIEFDIVQVDINGLRFDKKNARIHTKAEIQELERSISELGFHSFIVVQRKSNRVIVGNARLQALKNLGYSKVPVLFVDDDDTKALVRAVADNRMSDLSKFDENILKDIILMTKDDYLIPGFTAEDYDNLLGGLENEGEVVPVNPESDEEEFVEESSIMPVNPVYSRDQIVDAAYSHFMKEGLVSKMPVYAGMQEMNKLANLDVDDMTQSVLCHRIADQFHPQRYDLNAFGKKAPNKVLHDEPERFKKCLDKEIELKGSIPMSGKLGIALKAHGIAAIYNFRPGLALHYYKRFLNPGGLILDTSMGFGGRLIAAMAYRDCRYIGIDPAVAQYNGNKSMAESYGFSTCELINGCAESDEVRESVEPYFGKVDLCFTSPPYFNKEKYATDEDPTFVNQSSQKYKQYKDWVEHFLKPVLRLQFDALAKGKFSIINIDKVITDDTYPISNDTVKVAQDIGFNYIKAEYQRFGGSGLVPLSENLDEDSQEGFFIFQKP